MRATGLLLLLALLPGCAARGRSPVASVAVERKTLPHDRIEALVAEMNSDDPVRQAKAVWELSESRQVTPEAMSTIDRLIDSPVPAVEAAAVWAFSRFPRVDRTIRESWTSDTPPALLQQTRPEYPREAFDRKIQGVVRTTILISAAGDVAHAEVDRSVPLLDEAALRCVREWKFKPATRAGKPVPVVAVAPVAFRIF